MERTDGPEGLLDRLEPVFGQLEEKRKELMEERKRSLPSLYAGFAFIVTSIVLMIVYKGQVIGNWAIAGLIISLLYTLFILVSFTGSWKQLKAEIKQAIISKVLQVMYPDWTYDAKGYIDRELFVGSGLFAAPDSYSGEDLIIGKNEHAIFRMSQVNAQKSRSGDGRVGSSVIFNGFMVALEYEEPFPGEVYIYPDYAKKILGRGLGKAVQNLFSESPLVESGDPVFDESFKVYASDPSSARHLLENGLAQAILHIKSRQRTPIYLSLRGSHVTLALTWPPEYLEPDIYEKKPLKESDWLRRLAGELNAAVELVDVLEEGLDHKGGV